jgi:hypothetical protein
MKVAVGLASVVLHLAVATQLLVRAGGSGGEFGWGGTSVGRELGKFGWGGTSVERGHQPIRYAMQWI